MKLVDIETIRVKLEINVRSGFGFRDISGEQYLKCPKIFFEIYMANIILFKLRYS